MWALVCNASLEELRVSQGSEMAIVGPLTFHDLALIIAAACTLVAVVLSLFLVAMHVRHYTRPREQRHIMRIVLMVPIQAAASISSLRFHWHSLWFRLASDCFEALTISSFFALLGSLVGPDLRAQRQYFADARPVRPWVWPLSWFKPCCGGDRGPLKTPASVGGGGSTIWFKVVWFGVYQFVFVQPAAAVTAIVTQHFRLYCETSNSPVFAHVWLVAIVCASAAVAMYGLAQLYVQLRGPLAEHRLFLKLCAVNLVIFLTLWQSAVISIATSQLDAMRPTDVFAYPDLKVGIPSLLLCVEMALFSILNLWAFTYRPYREVIGARATFYPSAIPGSGAAPRENVSSSPSGGFLGLRAIWDALNPWDVIKCLLIGFGWLFVNDRLDSSAGNPARKGSSASSDDLDLSALPRKRPGRNSTEHLPIANQFRRSKFLMMNGGAFVDATAPGGNAQVGSAITADTTINTAVATAAPGAATAQPDPGTLSPLPQSPAPTSPGFQRQEHAALMAHAASPGRQSDHAHSPYRDPPSPYRDDVFPDDLANHPGVAIPYPGYSPESSRPGPPRKAPQPPPPQWQQQTTTPQRPARPTHQHNFSRTLAGPPPLPPPPPPNVVGRPQYRQTPPPQHPVYVQRRERPPESATRSGAVSSEEDKENMI